MQTNKFTSFWVSMLLFTQQKFYSLPDIFMDHFEKLQIRQFISNVKLRSLWQHVSGNLLYLLFLSGRPFEY